MRKIILTLSFLMGCSCLFGDESNGSDTPVKAKKITQTPAMLFFQKGKLNDKIMQFDLDPLQTKLEQHIYQIREGSPGGFDTSGGSCGCN